MDHAAISRALEERTKELDGLRRQLAREESEKHELFAQINSLVGEMAQLKQADEDLGSPRALELEQLKTDFGKKQAELQRSNQHLAEMREEVQRRERMAELERRRMEEELRERDELLKELTETGDELGRALNEANNDLQAAREQLAAVQQELAVARHRPAGEGAFTSENSSATLLQLEHFQRELTDLGAQLELAEQKIGRTEMEAAESEEMLRQKTVQLERAHAEVAAEKQITSQLTHRVAELEQRLAQVDVLCAEVSEELNRAEAALEEERGRHAAELQLIRQEQMDRAEQAKAAAGEEADEKVAKLEAECAQLLAEKHRSQTQLRTEQAAHELELQRAREQAQEEIEKSATEAARHNEENANEKLAQLEAENAKLATDLQMAQKSVESTMKAEKTNHQMELARARGELEANRAEANRAFELERRDLKEKLSQLEQENMVLSANLLAEQQRAERESRQQRNELERLQADLAREREEVERRRKMEQEEEEDQQKTPLQSPEPPSTPTAKPRKMLNGGGTAQTSTEEEQQQQREKQNFSEKEELLRLGAELDKQKRLVTVLRKKLQQQQLDALKRDREATTGQSSQQNGR